MALFLNHFIKKMSWAFDAMREAWEAEMREIHKGPKAVVSTEIAN